MTPPKGTPWNPDPQLLAAYLDGEFEGRADLDDLRQRIETWLADHPECWPEIGELRLLNRLWQTTTPADPSPAAWNDLFHKVRQRVGDTGTFGRLRESRSASQRMAALAIPLAAACLLVAVLGWRGWNSGPAARLPGGPGPGPIAAPGSEEVLEVATSEEVEILQVEGADTGTLVVGQLPVDDVLELMRPEDVALAAVPGDTQLRFGPHAPVIWARLGDD